MDFKNAKELLELSQNEKLMISEVMRQRELSETESSPEELYTKMERVLEIMKDSSSTPIHHPAAVLPKKRPRENISPWCRSTPAQAHSITGQNRRCKYPPRKADSNTPEQVTTSRDTGPSPAPDKHRNTPARRANSPPDPGPWVRHTRSKYPGTKSGQPPRTCTRLNTTSCSTWRAR